MRQWSEWAQHGRAATWRALVTLLSVMAVAAGFAVHEQPRGQHGATLAPTPLPEMRAALPLPPLVPQEIPALPPGRAGAGRTTARPDAVAPRVLAAHRPCPLAQSGRRQLEGG